MPQSKRPESIQLCKAPSVAHDYAYDVGTSHIVDRALYLAFQELIAYGRSDTIFYFGYPTHISQEQIGRYLDGEEEVEGTYR